MQQNKNEKIKLTKDEYDLIKRIDFSEMKDKIIFDDEENSILVSDFLLFELIVIEEININGLTDNQMRANEYGRALENLIDRLTEE